MPPLEQPLATADGSVLVDQDYGGPNALAYQTAQGEGVEGADLRVFRKTDYDAGNRSLMYQVGRTSTTRGGRWRQKLSLLPGEYTLVFTKKGQFGPNQHTLVVS